ncbi:hypothetical protein [Lignipirellula cremea]|uniref:Uncharacterized protein n=1 Tax=Lignipirellula cremea TaxID=2528010 RepID=A0A518E1X2_9BACT|nr:hypothetical protein [Lignipirellula cremea]QDU98089.1 hypothetical protein Pla8534_59500 [Lignipirellula cremea]
MIRKEDIPEIAICHICGEPMQTVDVAALARSLGYKVQSGSYSVECCGYELTVDDPVQGTQIVDILLAYRDLKRDSK